MSRRLFEYNNSERLETKKWLENPHFSRSFAAYVGRSSFQSRAILPRAKIPGSSISYLLYRNYAAYLRLGILSSVSFKGFIRWTFGKIYKRTMYVSCS